MSSGMAMVDRSPRCRTIEGADDASFARIQELGVRRELWRGSRERTRFAGKGGKRIIITSPGLEESPCPSRYLSCWQQYCYRLQPTVSHHPPSIWFPSNA